MDDAREHSFGIVSSEWPACKKKRKKGERKGVFNPDGRRRALLFFTPLLLRTLVILSCSRLSRDDKNDAWLLIGNMCLPTLLHATRLIIAARFYIITDNWRHVALRAALLDASRWGDIFQEVNTVTPRERFDRFNHVSLQLTTGCAFIGYIRCQMQWLTGMIKL